MGQNHVIIVERNFRERSPRAGVRANFFCKWPNGEYFKLFKPYDLCCRLLNSLVIVQKQLQTISKQMSVALFQ